MSKAKHASTADDEFELLPEEQIETPKKTPAKEEPPKVTHSGVLYSCVIGDKITLMADESLQTPGAAFELAKKGECTINGKAYPLDDLKRGDKVVLEGEPVSKVTATR